MIWKCHGIPCFHFYFLFRSNGKREQVNENDYRRYYGNFFFLKVSFQKYLITVIFKILSQQLRRTLTVAFERQLTIEDFTDMDQYRCRACTKTFDLLLYASLSLKQILCFTFLPFDILCILKFIQCLYAFFHNKQ